jgi:5-methylcytosine-specific restriction enzyme A
MISSRDRDHLQNVALEAFNGRPPKDLRHGFRIHKKGAGAQVAAVYWTDIEVGNEVEIAIAPGRIPERPDAEKVQAWLEIMREVFSSKASVHQHEQRWPTFGFSIIEALAFLKECKNLRIGFLKPEREQQVRDRIANRGVAEREQARLSELYEQLRPGSGARLIDLVKQAGISVDDWYETKDGRSVAKPSNNPGRKFNWSFGGSGGPALACLWHADVEVRDGHLVHAGNFLSVALALEALAADKTKPTEVWQRAQTQAPRARKLHELVEGVGEGGTLRVILNEGDMRDEEQLGEDSSEVSLRHLDVQPWIVHRFNSHTGDYELRRLVASATPKTVTVPPRASPTIPSRPPFVDQHDPAGSDEPEKSKRAGDAYARDENVRRQVLARAQGRCELCGNEGFATDAGSIYLETHHVVPLSEDGVDRVWNVVGLCPNHHREAHSGVARESLRERLKGRLRSRYGQHIQFVALQAGSLQHEMSLPHA